MGDHRSHATDGAHAITADTPARLALLADPTRLRLLFAVHAAPGATVTDLAAAADVTANNATKALGRLADAGLVAASRDGRSRRWRITDAAAHALLHDLGAPHTPLHPPHPDMDLPGPVGGGAAPGSVGGT